MKWKYYNHAMIPDLPPHEEVDVFAIKDGSVWKLGGGKKHPFWQDGRRTLIVSMKQIGGIALRILVLIF